MSELPTLLENYSNASSTSFEILRSKRKTEEEVSLPAKRIDFLSRFNFPVLQLYYWFV